MWLIVPSTSCRSAPATAGSTSELSLPCAERLASCAELSGKPRAARFWQKRWARDAWLRSLSGATCEPSTAERGAASWIASLAATRASLSASPVSAVDQMILGTCGRRSLASLRKSSPASCSSRTSPVTSLWDSPLSDESLSFWGSELRRDCLRRRKSARRTSGSGCSSSAWPTPDTGISPNGHGARGGSARNGSQSGSDLRAISESWPMWQTPDVGMTQGGRTARGKSRPENASLERQVWFQSSLPAPAPETGSESSPSGPTSRPRLNPAFVEWMMGAPPGWTDGACSETAFSLWMRRMRSRLCGLVCGGTFESEAT
jgi:hypothetical protein